MIKLPIKGKDLNLFIKVLKKVKVIGNSCLLYNNMIEPINVNEGIYGKHYLKHPFNDMIDEVLIINDIDTVLSKLDSTKGLRKRLIYESTDNRIIIHYDEGFVEVATQYTGSDDVQIENTFDIKLGKISFGVGWIPIPKSILNDLKNNKLVILQGNNKFVRFAKSKLPLTGVQRKDKDIDYSGSYTLTKKADGIGMLNIHMEYNEFQCIHQYAFAIYQRM